MEKKVKTMGIMARFSIMERRLFQSLDADRTSEQLRRAIRQMTVIMLISGTPT